MLNFKKLFGVPIGNALQWVKPQKEAKVIFGQWKHEEYDCDGGLVAVYECWKRKGSSFRFVKYSPYGWVLNISGRSPRLLPLKTRVQSNKAGLAHLADSPSSDPPLASWISPACTRMPNSSPIAEPACSR